MKTRITRADDLRLPWSVLGPLGWRPGDNVSIEMPVTGGLLIYKETDLTTHFTGVKEVVHENVQVKP